MPKGNFKRGSDSPLWRGGIRRCSGYIWLYKPEHPNCTKNRYIQEHRFVMEEKIGRYLTSNEQIHHINGIKDDNRIENLELMTKRVHRGVVECPYCEKEFTIR